MKVLHVITGIDRGGAENHLLELVKHQRASGMAVAVAYLRGQGYWAETFRKLGAQVFALGLRFYGDLRPLVALRRLIAESDFDLLHAHLPPAELYARLALIGGRRALPLIISKHNEERFSPGPGQRLLGRWVGSRAGYVIAISDAVKRYMTGPALGLDARKFSTIFYGIDAAPFDEVREPDAASLRKEWGLAEGALAVGFVGRLVEQKDVGTLIHGFALFSRKCSDARLIIVGTGPLEASLRQCAEEAGISARIVWAGFRSDIHRVMRAFDVFALTSIYEGLGLVLLEAMAARRAVVATRVGAIPEVVVAGETGLLIAPQCPAELAEALHKLTDDALRARLGEAGGRRVRHDFTLGKMLRQTDALYARCLQARHREAPTMIGPGELAQIQEP